MKEATSEVAYLVAAARQAAGLDERTASNTIKEMCDHLGVLSAGNFAATIDSLKGQGLTVTGTGSKKQLKLNGAGFEKAAEIVTRINGASQ